MPPKTRTRTVFVCQQCGSEQPKWTGRCPDCGEWNTFTEQTVTVAASASTMSPSIAARGDGTGNKPTALPQVQSGNFRRIGVPGDEFNRVLGGGIVPGSLVLVGGDPGIGKSTLLLQMAVLMAETDGPVLYVSGEESEKQIKMRAVRLAEGEALGLRSPAKAGASGEAALSEHLYLVTETNLEVILAHIQTVKPKVVVIDS